MNDSMMKIHKQLKQQLSKVEAEAIQIRQVLKALHGTNLDVATPKPAPRRRTVRHKITCKRCGKKFIPKPTGKVPLFCHRPCTSGKYNWEQGTTKKQLAIDKKALDEYKKASKKGELLMAGDPIRAAAGH
jgi:hypothetical protein